MKVRHRQAIPPYIFVKNDEQSNLFDQLGVVLCPLPNILMQIVYLQQTIVVLLCLLMSACLILSIRQEEHNVLPLMIGDVRIRS